MKVHLSLIFFLGMQVSASAETLANFLYKLHVDNSSSLKDKPFIVQDQKLFEMDIKPTVDLSHLYQDKVDLQIDGSCHVHSAAALFEANCYKKANVRLDLDENALFAQHLLNQLDKNKNDFTYDKLIESFDNLEGGFAFENLEKIESGLACEQEKYTPTSSALNDLTGSINNIQKHALKLNLKEIKPLKYSSSLPFFKSVEVDGKLVISPEPKNELERKLAQAMIQSLYHHGQYRKFSALRSDISSNAVKFFATLPIGNSATQSGNFHYDKYNEFRLLVIKYREQLKNEYEKEWPQHLKKIRSDLEIAAKIPTGLHDLSDNYKKCLSLQSKPKTKMKEEIVSRKMLLDLLDRGIPFICSSYVYYKNQLVETSSMDNRDSHAYNIVGYRKNPLALPDGIEFKTRDSTKDQHSWGWSLYNCRSVTYYE